MESYSSRFKKTPNITQSSKNSLGFNPKMRMFAFLLRKYSQRSLKQIFDQIYKCSEFKSKIFNRMQILIKKNQHKCINDAFAKIKKHSLINKSLKRIIKTLSLIFTKLQYSQITSCFKILYQKMKQTKKIQDEKKIYYKTILFLSKINRFYKSKKLSYKNKITVLGKNGKIRFLISTYLNIHKGILLKGFNKIFFYSYLIPESQKNTLKTNINTKEQISHLKYNVQNKIKISQQLDKGNKKLKDKSIDQAQYQQANGSYVQDDKSSDKRSQSNSFNKKSQDKLNTSKTPIHQKTFMSILSNSFNSINSRNSRNSKKSFTKFKNLGMDSINGEDCNCHFRYKYQEYKSLYTTEKNQLQILKKQLEVAKDLNQHFQNELTTYGAKPFQDNSQLERLKLSLEEINKDVEFLKNKVTKYQSHINNLKSDFKKKLQDIYRKYRKDVNDL